MDILYLLVPLSVALVFFILGGLWWAVYGGQFEDIEAEATRILELLPRDRHALDIGQALIDPATGNSAEVESFRSPP